MSLMCTTNVCEDGGFPSTKRKDRTSFSFAGGGFMGIYHIGVYMCVENESPPDYFADLKHWYGSSAGSLLSVSAACGVKVILAYNCIREMHNDLCTQYKLFGRFATFHPRFNMLKYLRDFLENYLPQDAHRRCRNRVGISLTVLPSLRNWIVTDFNTRAELIQAVICSCFVPLFLGFQIPQFRGKMCCDGGLSNNLPYSSDPNVITVSPFSGECDICPNGETETHSLVYVTGQAIQYSMSNMIRGLKTLLVSSWTEMEEICWRGYRDALFFMKREGIIPMTTVNGLSSLSLSNINRFSISSRSSGYCQSSSSDDDNDAYCLEEADTLLWELVEGDQDSSYLTYMSCNDDETDQVTGINRTSDTDSGIFLTAAACMQQGALQPP